MRISLITECLLDFPQSCSICIMSNEQTEESCNKACFFFFLSHGWLALACEANKNNSSWNPHSYVSWEQCCLSGPMKLLQLNLWKITSILTNYHVGQWPCVYFIRKLSLTIKYVQSVNWFVLSTYMWLIKLFCISTYFYLLLPKISSNIRTFIFLGSNSLNITEGCWALNNANHAQIHSKKSLWIKWSRIASGQKWEQVLS